jgi:hypothetical protein
MSKHIITLSATKVEMTSEHCEEIHLPEVELTEIMKNFPDAHIRVLDSEGYELITAPIRPVVDFMQQRNSRN